MAKSLPQTLLWIVLALVAEAARSPVSVNQDAPATGAQMLQTKGKKDVTLKRNGEIKYVSNSSAKPICAPDAVIFDFLHAQLLENNLGGEGPVPGPTNFIRYGNVGTLANGDKFDMLLEVLNTEGPDRYRASNPLINGLRGHSGQINVRATNEAKIKFTMVKTDGSMEPITLPMFYISVYDIDQNGYMNEQVTVSDFDEITVPDNAEYTLETTDAGTVITSAEFGRICDNPEEPTNLKIIKCFKKDEVDQARRAFTMLFKEKDSFIIEFKVGLTKDVRVGRNGRNLLFGGPTSLIEPCTTTTTSPPPPCVPDQINFDFESAYVEHSNLGGQGPDLGDDKWILYKGVGTVNGKSFDMKVVTNNADYEAGKPEKSGLQGKSGQINVAVKHKAVMTFSFLDSDSGEPVTLPAFYMSVFDIDVGPAAGEITTVRGFDEITVPANAQYKQTTNEDGDTVMTATNPGNACDNPEDPENLGIVKCDWNTVDTRTRAFTMRFKEKSSVDIDFEAPLRPGGEAILMPKAGRNMQFAGHSDIIDNCPTAD